MAKLNEFGLTDRQEVFCQEYIKDFNGTQAAIRAGYKMKSANEIASENLAKPNIAARVKALIKETSQKNESMLDRIKAELIRIAFANKKSVARWNQSGVTFKDSDELTDDEAASIAEVSETVTDNGGTLKIKQHDKVKALELLAKMEGGFIQEVKHTGSISLEQLVSGSIENDE